jgi:penicillin-binding protein 2
LELIRRALYGVVEEPHGTGYKAKVDGVRVAGKTGTAQVVRLDPDKNYEKEEDIPYKFRDHALFVAYAEADRPTTLALAIIIEHGGHGASTAAPIANKLIQAYFKTETQNPAVVQNIQRCFFLETICGQRAQVSKSNERGLKRHV